MSARRVKLPSFQFYPGDWLRDAGLRACTAASRGVWMDLLCFMHDSPTRGQLLKANGQPFTDAELSRALGCTPTQLRRHLAELESAGVFDRNEHGVIVSRRMAADEDARRQASLNGAKGGNPELLRGKPEGLPQTGQVDQPDANRGVNPPLNRGVGDGISPSSSSSSSSTSTKQEEEPPKPPPAGGAGDPPPVNPRDNPGDNPPPGKPATRPRESDPGPDTVPIPAELDTPQFREAWSLWLGDRRDKQGRRIKTTRLAAETQLERLVPLGPKAAAECIRDSIANQWQGLFPDKFQQRPPSPKLQTKGDRMLDEVARAAASVFGDTEDQKT